MSVLKIMQIVILWWAEKNGFTIVSGDFSFEGVKA